MITIQKFVFNPFSENTYVVFNDEKKAVIIDPGMYHEEEEKAIDNFITSSGLKVEAIWHTHSHLDHMFGTGYACSKYDLLPIVFEKDLVTYQSFERVCAMYGVPIRNSPPDKVQFMDLKKDLTLGTTKFNVLFVPGHAPGHVVFYHAQSKMLINGDCLFRESIGRTDLPGGNHNQLINSIKSKLFSLPDDTKVYSGHGPETTIGHEKAYNPFVNY